MLLQNRDMRVTIPHTSTCIIRTKGVINDGDTILIISPVFASINFQSGSIEMTEGFEAPIRILTANRSIVSDGSYRATLVCDDNDVFQMYVRVQ